MNTGTWDCGKYKKFGMYTNKLHELLTPDLSLDKQEIWTFYGNWNPPPLNNMKI